MRIVVFSFALLASVIALVVTHAGTMLVVRRPVLDPDVIVSLASHEWERLPTTAHLAAVHGRAFVLLTEPAQVTRHNCHDCFGRDERLSAMGVDGSRVHVGKLTSPGTHGEALAALAFAREHKVRAAVIVTSPYHTRRALAVFRKVFDGTGVQLGIEPAFAASRAQPERWWWQPDDRAYVPYEWIAIAYYAWAYDVPLF